MEWSPGQAPRKWSHRRRDVTLTAGTKPNLLKFPQLHTAGVPSAFHRHTKKAGKNNTRTRRLTGAPTPPPFPPLSARGRGPRRPVRPSFRIRDGPVVDGLRAPRGSRIFFLSQRKDEGRGTASRAQVNQFASTRVPTGLGSAPRRPGHSRGPRLVSCEFRWEEGGLRDSDSIFTQVSLFNSYLQIFIANEKFSVRRGGLLGLFR